MKHPTVSVLMPNYNGAKFISKAIESILNQSFGDFEFIIIDDGSSDNSRDIIQKFAKKDNRIHAIKNEKNLKICNTLNKGIQLAKGKYIARMDSDDISFLKRFEKQVLYLDENPNIGVVGSNCIFINEKGSKGEIKKFPSDNKEIRKSIWKRNPLLHPSLMIRKECFNNFGGYDESFLYAEDLELWIRFGQKYNFSNLQEKLLYYRISGENSTLRKQKLMIKNALKARRSALKMGYNIDLMGRIFLIGTWCMKFLPPKFVLWLFNKINK